MSNILNHLKLIGGDISIQYFDVITAPSLIRTWNSDPAVPASVSQIVLWLVKELLSWICILSWAASTWRSEIMNSMGLICSICICKLRMLEIWTDWLSCCAVGSEHAACSDPTAQHEKFVMEIFWLHILNHLFLNQTANTAVRTRSIYMLKWERVTLSEKFNHKQEVSELVSLKTNG